MKTGIEKGNCRDPRIQRLHRKGQCHGHGRRYHHWGGLDFSGLGFALGEGEEAAVFAYGNFIMALINFLIIAWVVFILVKMVNRVKDSAMKQEEPAAKEPAAPSETDLLIEIRDALKARS